MKTIGIVFSPNKIFDACSYYSLNRVLIPSNPNYAHEVNDTYGITADDREFFFDEAFKRACADLATITTPLRKGIVFTDINGVLPCGFTLSFLASEATFYCRVTDKFPLYIFFPQASQFLRDCILVEWYKMKNQLQEVEVLTLEIEELKLKIKSAIDSFGKEKRASLRYNNGFTNSYSSPEPMVDTIVNVGDIRIFTSEYTNQFN